MEITINSYKNVYRDLDRAFNEIYKTNDIDEVVSAGHGIMSFSFDLQVNPNDEFRRKMRFFKETPQYQESYSSAKRYEKKAKRIYSLNEKQLTNIYKKQYEMLDNNTKYFRGKYVYHEVDDYTQYKILREYFLHEEHEFLPMFDEFINCGKILPCYDNNIAACSVMAHPFENSYIRINNKHNIKDMINIVHELAHIRYYDLLLKDSARKSNEYCYTSLFLESYPILKEYKFLKYLAMNEKFREDVKTYLKEMLCYHHYLLIDVLKPRFYIDRIPKGSIRVLNGNIGGELFETSKTPVLTKKQIEKTDNIETYFEDFSTDELVDTCKTRLELIKRL